MPHHPNRSTQNRLSATLIILISLSAHCQTPESPTTNSTPRYTTLIKSNYISSYIHVYRPGSNTTTDESEWRTKLPARYNTARYIIPSQDGQQIAVLAGTNPTSIYINGGVGIIHKGTNKPSHHLSLQEILDLAGFELIQDPETTNTFPRTFNDVFQHNAPLGITFPNNETHWHKYAYADWIHHDNSQHLVIWLPWAKHPLIWWNSETAIWSRVPHQTHPQIIHQLTAQANTQPHTNTYHRKRSVLDALNRHDLFRYINDTNARTQTRNNLQRNDLYNNTVVNFNRLVVDSVDRRFAALYSDPQDIINILSSIPNARQRHQHLTRSTATSGGTIISTLIGIETLLATKPDPQKSIVICLTPHTPDPDTDPATQRVYTTIHSELLQLLPNPARIEITDIPPGRYTVSVHWLDSITTNNNQLSDENWQNLTRQQPDDFITIDKNHKNQTEPIDLTTLIPTESPS